MVGRLGCFAVACCHDRPARFGVVYGEHHVRVGFWARWRGRRVWPTQIVESAASLALVIVALAIGWDAPGVPAVVYSSGYALVRFALELVRGDAARPHRRGLSEAQWSAVATAIACAAWRPSLPAVAIVAVLVAAAGRLVVTRRRRELFAPSHLAELDRTCAETSRTRQPAVTSLGVSISRYGLPDGRVDWVMSSTRVDWSVATARPLAELMWHRFEIFEGRIPGIVHVVEPAQ